MLDLTAESLPKKIIARTFGFSTARSQIAPTDEAVLGTTYLDKAELACNSR
jgi:hypothetical protein